MSVTSRPSRNDSNGAPTVSTLARYLAKSDENVETERATRRRAEFLWAAANVVLPTAPGVSQHLAQTLFCLVEEVAPGAAKFHCPQCAAIMVPTLSTRSRVVSAPERGRRELQSCSQVGSKRKRTRRGLRRNSRKVGRRRIRDPAWSGGVQTAVSRLCFLCAATWLESDATRLSDAPTVSETPQSTPRTPVATQSRTATRKRSIHSAVTTPKQGVPQPLSDSRRWGARRSEPTTPDPTIASRVRTLKFSELLLDRAPSPSAGN
mmetsp:Transcript_4825/g.9753  ORF Transcript_4825/g.9753 Transcript_4825/m.9753 type:complete len:263 (-) Transcript_4825:129-917(-)